jgi:hypothetical protein
MRKALNSALSVDGHFVTANAFGRGSVMPGLKALSSKDSPPVSIACAICGGEMALESVGLGASRDVYIYQCPTGHRQEFVIAKKQ